MRSAGYWHFYYGGLSALQSLWEYFPERVHKDIISMLISLLNKPLTVFHYANAYNSIYQLLTEDEKNNFNTLAKSKLTYRHPTDEIIDEIYEYIIQLNLSITSEYIVYLFNKLDQQHQIASQQRSDALLIV